MTDSNRFMKSFAKPDMSRRISLYRIDSPSLSFFLRMIDAIETVDMLPPFLVLDAGCHTLQSVVSRKEVDEPSKDHALRQVVTFDSDLRALSNVMRL